MVLGRWVARLISFEAGWCGSRAVCTVSRSSSPGTLQRLPPMSVRALISRMTRSMTPVPSSGPPRRASRDHRSGHVNPHWARHMSDQLGELLRDATRHEQPSNKPWPPGTPSVPSLPGPPSPATNERSISRLPNRSAQWARVA